MNDRERRKIVKAAVDKLIKIAPPVTLELIMELKHGTIKKWQTGKFSREEFAVIRMLDTFPWILSVAQERFDPDYAQYAVEVESAKIRYLEKKRLQKKV